jgi:hypothetical protein
LQAVSALGRRDFLEGPPNFFSKILLALDGVVICKAGLKRTQSRT